MISAYERIILERNMEVLRRLLSQVQDGSYQEVVSRADFVFKMQSIKGDLTPGRLARHIASFAWDYPHQSRDGATWVLPPPWMIRRAASLYLTY